MYCVSVPPLRQENWERPRDTQNYQKRICEKFSCYPDRLRIRIPISGIAVPVYRCMMLSYGIKCLPEWICEGITNTFKWYMPIQQIHLFALHLFEDCYI